MFLFVYKLNIVLVKTMQILLMNFGKLFWIPFVNEKFSYLHLSQSKNYGNSTSQRK
jgi:hypothetical protein